MTRRYARKTGKWRGSSSHGCGNAKNRRGKGNKGGKGRAGKGKHNKHKWTYVVVYERDRIGRHGFAPLSHTCGKTINLWEINSLAEQGGLEKEKDRFVFAFEGKVLGSGYVNYPLKIKAKSISKMAKAKIEAKGGVVEIAA
jgi:large subunit ribosomal protein L15